jgi:PX-associated
MATPKRLSSQRSEALFDLLIHRQLYFREFLRFNTADGTDGFGPPFAPAADDAAARSSSPVSQSVVARFVLPLPGVRSIAPAFWDNVRRLMEQFSAANLSESYDHKGLGLRRLLAAGVAALLESPARGSLVGLAGAAPGADCEYDVTDADDLKQGWRTLLYGLVYESTVDELFETVARTPDLSEHPASIQAAHEYMLIK